MQTEHDLQDSWSLESIGIKDKVDTKFRETLKFENDRLYVNWS